MRTDHLHAHLSRRKLLGGAAKLGAAGVAANLAGAHVLGGLAGASEPHRHGTSSGPGACWDGGDGHIPTGVFDDSFSVSGAADGSWQSESTARYGADDQLGTLNEISPEKTAAALKLLEGSAKVVTHRMGHTMRNGFPAFVTFPPRRYEQRLIVTGFNPEDEEFFSTTTRGFAGEDEWREEDRERGPLGYLQTTAAVASNKLSIMEERFPEGLTYQIATQLDNLNHVGVGDFFYNGNMGPDIASPTGTTRLGMEHVEPFVTRGLLLDVLGYKQKTDSSVVQVINGHPMLADTYRITVEDLQDTMRWEGVDAVSAGDVVVIRTGWNQLAEDPDTSERYLATEPGIYIAEAKFLAANRPAVIAADTWALEVLGNTDVSPDAFAPVHQLLLTRWGIRIGEGVISDDLAADGVHEFVYSYAPVNAIGATAGSVPPVAMARG